MARGPDPRRDGRFRGARVNGGSTSPAGAPIVRAAVRAGLGALAALPLDAALGAGERLGRWMFRRDRERRLNALTNLALVFPDLATDERHALAERSFVQLGMAVAELAQISRGSGIGIIQRARYVGAERLDEALAAGRGAVLVQAHASTNEVSACLLGSRWRPTAIVEGRVSRPQDGWVRDARGRWLSGVVPNTRLRAAVRALSAGGTVWLSPDIRVDERHGGVPSCFLGLPVPSPSLAPRLATLAGAPVLPVSVVRDVATRRYTVTIGAPLESGELPVPGAVQAINDALERHVRADPDGYLWGERRLVPWESRVARFAKARARAQHSARSSLARADSSSVSMTSPTHSVPANRKTALSPGSPSLPSMARRDQASSKRASRRNASSGRSTRSIAAHDASTSAPSRPPATKTGSPSPSERAAPTSRPAPDTGARNDASVADTSCPVEASCRTSNTPSPSGRRIESVRTACAATCPVSIESGT